MSIRFQTRGAPRSQSVAFPESRSSVDELLRAPSAALAFAAAFMRNPRSVGAVAPASRWLAEAMGEQIDGCNCHTLVEVGPGTGAITRVLNERRYNFARVVAVERDQSMVSILRERYSDLEIVHGCASELPRHVGGTAPVAVVSSLPFKSLPQDVAQACVQAIVATLDADTESLLVQYTYGLGSPPFAAPEPRFTWSRVALVLRNLPPATIWRLEHTHG